MEKLHFSMSLLIFYVFMAIALGKKILPRVLKCCSDFGTNFFSGAFL
jgi:hypothetical protein